MSSCRRQCIAAVQQMLSISRIRASELCNPSYRVPAALQLQTGSHPYWLPYNLPICSATESKQDAASVMAMPMLTDDQK